MKKYIIIPDIHGRTFWKRPVNDYIEKSDVHFIFMGDYLDPYSFEQISNESAIHNFHDIINLKKKYPEKITLLLGNHDIHYLTQFNECYKSRCISDSIDEIRKIFEENFSLFRIAAEIIDETNRILLTHAGVTIQWVYDMTKRFEYEIENDTKGKESAKKYMTDKFDCNWLNSLMSDENGMWLLWMVGRSRGGRSRSGSCVWADYFDHDYFEAPEIEELTGYNYQIYSHSLASPNGIDTFELNDKFAMIDCRKPFIYENLELRLLYNEEES